MFKLILLLIYDKKLKEYDNKILDFNGKIRHFSNRNKKGLDKIEDWVRDIGICNCEPYVSSYYSLAGFESFIYIKQFQKIEVIHV